ncbi:MAG: hypothetical protein ABIH38_04650 [Patescibacteria group bacterium]
MPKVTRRLRKPRVTFRKKTSWQKDDCLFCTDPSTLEAVFGNAMIRCCEKKACKKMAAGLAKTCGKI